jgi:hypothetical protein
MVAVAVKKILAGSDRRGHFGRNAFRLGGYSPAHWGVFVDGAHKLTVLKRGTFWEVLDAATSRRVGHRGFESRVDAVKAAVALAEETK